jgi:hypothetical protein
METNETLTLTKETVNQYRLYMVCSECGQLESMAPTEAVRNGEAHYFIHHHRNECGSTPSGYVIPFGKINAMYAIRDAGKRRLFLEKNGYHFFNVELPA